MNRKELQQWVLFYLNEKLEVSKRSTNGNNWFYPQGELILIPVYWVYYLKNRNFISFWFLIHWSIFRNKLFSFPDFDEKFLWVSYYILIQVDD